MAQQNRSKELWLIPKRGNLHQTICLIDGIIDRNYSGTSWNPSKQDNLGVNLKKWGATNDGKNISQQSIRTLVASIPQYLGFLYIDPYANSKTNILRLTPAGQKLWDNNNKKLVKLRNLRDDKNKTIQTSDDVLHQMEKLQLTNPIILKDCENISVFPFRFLAKLKKKIGYIDQEEIGYYLLRAKEEDQVDTVALEIQNFRQLSIKQRETLIDTYKNTHIGNITLKQAPSAGYFIAMCQMTGVIEKFKARPANRSKSIAAIRNEANSQAYIDQMLAKYSEVSTFDFKDDLKLWIDYIGEPSRELPPIMYKIISENDSDILWMIEKDGTPIDGNLASKGDIIEFPVFLNEPYDIKLYSLTSGEILETIDFKAQHEEEQLIIPQLDDRQCSVPDTVDSYVSLIQEHCTAKNFSDENLSKLKVIADVFKQDKSNDKQLRGAYLEYYFFKLLTRLQHDGVVDGVIWNGKIGRYGLPIQAPGGTTGTPDIVFKIDDVDFVLELTTIKPKAQQWSAEGASVPDHVLQYAKKTSGTVHGIFSAPIMHSRNVTGMKTAIASHGLQISCLTIDDLLKIFKELDREKILKALLNNHK